MKSSLLVFAAIAITVAFAGPASLKYGHNAPSARVIGEDYRLPNNTHPVHYDIKLVPKLDDDVPTFDAEAAINVTVMEGTSTITLHVDELQISNTTVTSENSVLIISNTTYLPDRSGYLLTFDTALIPGSYLITIKYSGALRDDLTGFYRSYYNTSSGQKRWYASSFFAPSYARRAFPCFDEPALKARFDISIAHMPNQVALSNALYESISDPDSTIGNRVWTKFATTPLMSTYLVAWLVSDFEYVSNDDGSFKIWSRPEALGSTGFSLGSVSLLKELNNFTGIDYESSLLKMDQVAMPITASIAMENWGLVTYSEAWLLWKDGESTTRDKQNIETTIAHEFAHQWFGNLVTPEWWKYLWLSEGFASFFEYYTAAQVNPSWRLMEQFTVDMCHPALLADSLDTSHPLNQDVYSPDEVRSAFNVINYNKGACVLWMLLNVLGPNTFRTGLQIYLEDNLYGTGTPDKLWDAIIEADRITDSFLLTHVGVKPFMDTWTNQNGYPLVTVTRNYSNWLQEISQEPFLLKGRGSSKDTAGRRWWIPITFASRTTLNFGPTATNNWIRAQDESVMLSGFLPTDWIIFNSQQTAYFRVNYDEQNWKMITEFIQGSNFTQIPPVNRAQLIDDSFNLARAGYINYDIPLSLSQYMAQETDHIPWTAAFNAFAYLQRMLAHSTSYAQLEAYLFSLVAPIHRSLGYAAQEDDQHVTSFLRSNAHSWACRLGCPGCLTRSRQFIQDLHDSNGNSPVPVDLRAWAYCEGLRNAPVDLWNFMWNRYLATDVAGEQTIILAGLGCSLNEEILNRYLSFSIGENSGVRSHHRQHIFHSVYSRSPLNVDIALEFLLNHINEASVFYGGPRVVGTLLHNIAGHLVTESQLAPLRKFISEGNDLTSEFGAAVQGAVELAEENIAWLEVYEDDITRWLATMQGAGNSLVALSPILLVVVSAILNFTG